MPDNKAVQFMLFNDDLTPEVRKEIGDTMREHMAKIRTLPLKDEGTEVVRVYPIVTQSDNGSVIEGYKIDERFQRDGPCCGLKSYPLTNWEVTVSQLDEI